MSFRLSAEVRKIGRYKLGNDKIFDFLMPLKCNINYERGHKKSFARGIKSKELVGKAELEVTYDVLSKHSMSLKC